ncbi:polyketide cyclase [bacterium]|nr:polyketide cyclase [bacterium]
MFKKLIVILLIALAGFAALAAMQPSEMHVTRTAVIKAPASAIFPLVNDLHKWDSWSPWAKLDPNATVTFAGPESGKGSSMTWKGNNEVGEGTLTITDSKENEHIGMHLDFVKPMAGTNTADFTLKEENGETTVTWSMDAHKNFLAKAIGLVMDCEKMVGENYEQAFASIKALVEKSDRN